MLSTLEKKITISAVDSNKTNLNYTNKWNKLSIKND